MLFYPILLPWPILLHALGLTTLGCSMLLAKPNEESPEDISTLGITTIALGMSYISTSYMPIAENQFLHASAPIRVLLALLAGLKWLTIDAENARLYEKRNVLLGVLLYDGLGGLLLGWYLGTFSGKVAAFRILPPNQFAFVLIRLTCPRLQLLQLVMVLVPPRRSCTFHFFFTYHHGSHITRSLNLADNVPRANTRTTVASGGGSLHPPFVPAPCRSRTVSSDPVDTVTSSLPPSPLMPLSESSVTRDPPPHLPPRPKVPAASSSRPKAHAPSSSAMSKLDYPKLNEELSPTVIHGWLGHCEDTFESWQAMNPDKLIAARTLITLAGLKMEESTAATWWNENHDKLKKLESWAEFAQEVRGRFFPSNWRMLALAAFYSIQQGSSSFLEFAKALQNARNALAGAGQSWVISDAVLKNHLLFLSHPVLRLRISGQQSLPFTTMKVDTLIATMSSTWDSMLAEGAIRVPCAPLAPSQLVIPSVPAALSSSLPTPPSSASPSGFVPLTHAEKEALRAAGGCYHCRKTPQSPGWVKHRSDSCPGDAAHGIPSQASPAVVAAIGPVGFSSTYEEGYKAVAAVMPTYNPEEDKWSYGTDDSDLSTRDS